MALEVVVCPKCGTVFNTADPRVRKLSPATLNVWESAPQRFRQGATMGPKELSPHAHLDPSTVHYHLRKLHAVGLVSRIPMRRNGRTPVRHVYAGIPRNT